MAGLEEWPSSTEFGLQAACNVAPAFPNRNPGLSIFAVRVSKL